MVGVVLGIITATLILEKHLAVNIPVLLFSLLFGIVCSTAVTGYFELKLRLEEKIMRLRAAELKNEQLRRIESEVRFNSLQAKLNPHFLFNSLNSTAALIYESPKKAEESILRLSELYRKILSFSNQTYVSIEEEIELIEDYLELEKNRFGDKLSYQIVCPESLKKKPIPGLMVEPLVENVIKHVQDKSERTIRIHMNITSMDKYLSIVVEDDGSGFDVDRASFGYGLYSVQERLKLMFGEDYGFDIDSKIGRGSKVSLRIPLSMESSDD